MATKADPTEDDPIRGDKLGDSKSKLDNSVMFVLAPKQWNSDKVYNYKKKVPEMIAELKKNLPDSVQVYDDAQYTRPEEDDVLSVLFEYDPKSPGPKVRLMLGEHKMVTEGTPGKDLKMMMKD